MVLICLGGEGGGRGYLERNRLFIMCLVGVGAGMSLPPCLGNAGSIISAHPGPRENLPMGGCIQDL